MNKVRFAALAYVIVSAVTIAFQFALAAGVPWGEFAMGGAFPGQFPPELRVAAVVQAGVLAWLASIVLARAGIALPKWARMSRWAIWVVVTFSALSFILNTITPSVRERAIWAPVGFVLLISSLIVASSPSTT